ncbi:AP endonuclease 1 [Apiospora kogelbergensis]|uniref:AP endonuclease 1 n=1 Tax=Apiospora kogelbergensis TaxID=1337665 RepID=UPI003132193E
MPRQSLRTRRTVAEASQTKPQPEPEPKKPAAAATPKKTRTAAAAGPKAATGKVSDVEEEESDSKLEAPTAGEAKASRNARATKRKTVAEDDDEVVKAEKASKPAAKKMRTAKAKIEDIVPLAKRTAVSSLKKTMYIGAHVSGAGGVQNSVHNAVHIGANAFALFLKSQRKWDNPPLAAEARDAFRSLSKEHGFDSCRHCVPHGSYLVNLAAAEKAKADQAYTSFLDDLRRCDALGIVLYNFHPGNTNGGDRAEAISRIAAQLNKAHQATKGSKVVAVLENMAGQGNVIGCKFEDLRDIIAQVDDKSRVGVCIDTCHTFAAGYDLRTPEVFAKTVQAFDDLVGNSYLRAFHLNDSKAPFDSHRDLHANIGTGFLGLRAFHNVMNHAPFQGLPMVLETPIDRKGADGKAVEDKQIWADEIKLLESLIGMDPEGDEFKALDVKLQKQGEAERNKLQAQADKKGSHGSQEGGESGEGQGRRCCEEEGARKRKQEGSRFLRWR